MAGEKMFMDFRSYIELFEQEVVVTGIESGMLGKEESVPVRSGKLAITSFAKKIGPTVNSSIPFAVDYYGFFKKSKGFRKFLQLIAKNLLGKQVKEVQIPLVHFAAIQIEDVVELAESPDIVTDFVNFKKELLTLRGFTD